MFLIDNLSFGLALPCHHRRLSLSGIPTEAAVSPMVFPLSGVITGGTPPIAIIGFDLLARQMGRDGFTVGYPTVNLPVCQTKKWQMELIICHPVVYFLARLEYRLDHPITLPDLIYRQDHIWNAGV
jgi:hypothetical protein